jgi:hypothetical protein
LRSDPSYLHRGSVAHTERALGPRAGGGAGSTETSEPIQSAAAATLADDTARDSLRGRTPRCRVWTAAKDLIRRAESTLDPFALLVQNRHALAVTACLLLGMNGLRSQVNQGLK